MALSPMCQQVPRRKLSAQSLATSAPKHRGGSMATPELLADPRTSRAPTFCWGWCHTAKAYIQVYSLLLEVATMTRLRILLLLLLLLLAPVRVRVRVLLLPSLLLLLLRLRLLRLLLHGSGLLLLLTLLLVVVVVIYCYIEAVATNSPTAKCLFSIPCVPAHSPRE